MAIVDPGLVASCPAPPTSPSDTGLDVLTQAVEGYTCTWHNDLTDGLCLHASPPGLRVPAARLCDSTPTPRRASTCTMLLLCAGLGFGNAMASLAHAMWARPGAPCSTCPTGGRWRFLLPYTIEFAVAPGARALCSELAHAFTGCSYAGGERAASPVGPRTSRGALPRGSASTTPSISPRPSGSSWPRVRGAALAKLVDDASTTPGDDHCPTRTLL